MQWVPAQEEEEGDPETVPAAREEQRPKVEPELKLSFWPLPTKGAVEVELVGLGCSTTRLDRALQTVALAEENDETEKEPQKLNRSPVVRKLSEQQELGRESDVEAWLAWTRGEPPLLPPPSRERCHWTGERPGRESAKQHPSAGLRRIPKRGLQSCPPFQPVADLHGVGLAEAVQEEQKVPWPKWRQEPTQC